MANMIIETINLEPENLLPKVMDLKTQGYRLVQICCTKTTVFEFIYSFDIDYKLLNLKLTFEKPIDIYSITNIFPGAFLYENEIHELFGIQIKGINIDYKGSLYKTTIKNPFNPETSEV